MCVTKSKIKKMEFLGMIERSEGGLRTNSYDGGDERELLGLADNKSD